jgi:DNA-directed RNA polymerase subunit beta
LPCRNRPTANKRDSKKLWQNQENCRNPGFDRYAARFLPAISSNERRPEKREDIGLQAVFKSVFPIKDFTGSASLEFVSYRFAEIKHSEEECVHRGMTYEMPVRITVRLVVYDVDKETGVSNIRDIKEQEIYFGTIPLMTEKGTFIINGTERVVVSQLHRSSGVFFDHDKGKSHSSGKLSTAPGSFPCAGPGSTWRSIPRISSTSASTAGENFPLRYLFKAFGYSAPRTC